MLLVTVTDIMVICGTNENENIRLGRVKPDWKKYMLSSTCSVQIYLCAEIFSGHLAHVDNCAISFGANG